MTARTSFASTPCAADTLSMIAPYGTAASAATTTGAGGAGMSSGYGTSSGAMRAIVEGSHTISPPALRTSTSDSPSIRWDFTDIVLPFWKYTSSAFAGAAAARVTRTAALTRVNIRMEDADTQFARVLIIRRPNQRRDEGFVD